MRPEKSNIRLESLLKKNEDLKLHSNWRIGGTVDYFAEPGSPEELGSLLRYAQNSGLPVQIIGKGTNILFDDEGYRGLIIKIDKGFDTYDIQKNSVIAGAGAWTPCFARAMGSIGFTGIEHTIGIPGSLGGLVVMNGGSKGRSISSNITRVFVMDYSGTRYVLNMKECEFNYRQSVFQNNDLIIYNIEFKFEKGIPANIRNEMLSILKERKRKFPLKKPNCGSTFISDPELFKRYGPPGKIIEELGLKGYRQGGALVSPQHANFIINEGSATSKDILKIVRHIRQKIFALTGVWIKSEIRYLSPDNVFHFLSQI